MNLKQQIKSNRLRFSLSQEDLAEKIYVTRQTISNWENGKSYPDINSLMLLSLLFGISIDDLVKGDIQMMEEENYQDVIVEFNRLSKICTVLLIILVISIAPLTYYLKTFGWFIVLIMFISDFIIACKLDRIKKKCHLQTYREIQAFMDGKKLDEIQKAEERGKRNYQIVANVIGAIIFGVFAFFLAYFMMELIAG